MVGTIPEKRILANTSAGREIASGQYLHGSRDSPAPEEVTLRRREGPELLESKDPDLVSCWSPESTDETRYVSWST
jgi:hypothetical protein